MQNPFRHQDQPERPEREDWRARGGERRPDEYRSWGGGDGGRSAEAWRGQGREHDRPTWASDQDRPGQYGQSAQYGQSSQYGQQGQYRQYDQPRSGSPYGPGGYQGSQAWYGGAPQTQQGRPFEQSAFDAPWGSPEYGHESRSQYGSMEGRYGARQAYGGRTYGGQGYTAEGYAPGAQIWQGSGREMGGEHASRHDFEPDYLHWREQQLSRFDKDYSDWRNERREKFSSDFDTWRQNRPRTEASGEQRTQAENPIVGDVSDGGTGSSAETRKR